MNKLPEKVYLRPRKIIDGMALVEFKSNELCFCEESEPKLVNYIEYVRKDVAEQMAKDFAIKYADYMFDLSLLDQNIDELFTEFINSRKAQKE